MCQSELGWLALASIVFGEAESGVVLTRYSNHIQQQLLGVLNQLFEAAREGSD